MSERVTGLLLKMGYGIYIFFGKQWFFVFLTTMLNFRFSSNKVPPAGLARNEVGGAFEVHVVRAMLE